MTISSTILNAIRQKWRRIDPNSLQLRLTLEITFLFILGLGSIAVWTSWKMQQILIVTHKQNVEYIAERFPRDVQLYSEMLPVETGLQKTIDSLSTSNLLVWVKRPDGKLLAQSATMSVPSTPTAALISLSDMPIESQVYKIGDRYLILSASSLMIKGEMLGMVYVAADVSENQQQLISSRQSLAIASTMITVVIMGAITFRVRRSLQPLQQMSQMAGAISAEDLKEAKLQLSYAPSEVKELAQTFNMMLSRLSDAWEQQREFVSNVSHELRTPLTIVLGYLQSLLRRSTNLNVHQREALETAASETERTVRLLQELLDLARADSGFMPLYLETIVLNDLVVEVAEMAKNYSDRLITIVETGNIEVTTDRDRLRQVLINLIDNAVKYSDSNQPITLKLAQTDKQATIQVCDRGSGIPLQQQSRIFERFYRLDEARSRSTGGYGLGLAIVKTLVEGMGGNISVRSKPGEGSVFTVTLPTQL